MSMMVMNSSSTDIHMCSNCGKKTGNSYVYCERGLEIKMPFCANCMETRSDEFYSNIKKMMSFRINQIKGDINTEVSLTFNKLN